MNNPLKLLPVKALALLVGLFATTHLIAQTDSTQMQKAAAAVCKCMSRNDVTASKDIDEIEVKFTQCMFDSAGGMLTEIMTKAMESGANIESLAETFGKELGMEMVKQNCSTFLKMSMKMSGGSEKTGEKVAEKNTKNQVLTELYGTVVSVVEGEFLSLTLETENGRKQTLYYFEYVPKSDDWLKDLKLLTGKKVSIKYKEAELYRPKLKTFIPIKQIVELNLMVK